MELSFEIPPPPPPPPPPKVFAEHWTQIGMGIRKLRESRGLTQAQLAVLVDVERTSIVNIEKGRQRLGIDLLDKLATALGMRLAMRLEPLDGPTRTDALEDVFFRTPMCFLRFDPNDDDAAGVPDEQIKQAIQSDRLKLLTAIRELSGPPGVQTPAEPCPRGEVSKPEPTCTNRHQCWEPCGELGHSMEHAVAVLPPGEHYGTGTRRRWRAGNLWR